MAARVALKEQALFLVKDASDLYDSYFTLLDRDLQLFSNQTLLKVFGLISFFYTIDIRDRVFLNRVLDTFDLTYSSFAEALEQLHGKELIEIQFNHAKISEQVLGTYIFYRVFLKKNNYRLKHYLKIISILIQANLLIQSYLQIMLSDMSRLNKKLNLRW